MKKFYKYDDYGQVYERCISYRDILAKESNFHYTINHPYAYFLKSYSENKNKHIYFFMHLKNNLDIEENFQNESI